MPARPKISPRATPSAKDSPPLVLRSKIAQAARNGRNRKPIMKVLGIDPGLNTTGYGVLEFANNQPRLVEAGVVRSKSSGSLAERVKELHDGVAEIIAALRPEVMAIEELYSHYERPTTAILMGHARGVIILAAAD